MARIPYLASPQRHLWKGSFCLASLGCAFMCTGFRLTPSEPFQINHPELNAETQPLEEPIEIEIPEPYRKIWEKEIKSSKSPGFAFTEGLEAWLKGEEIDLRPPEILLQFQDDLEFMEDEAIPGAPLHADLLYIGFPDKKGENLAPQLWTQVIEALDHLGIHPAAPLSGPGWGFSTTWKHWEERQMKLDTQVRYALKLVKLKNRKPLYLKCMLLDGYQIQAPSARPPSPSGHYALSTLTRRRVLRKLVNRLLLEMEKKRREQQRLSWIKNYPTIELEKAQETDVSELAENAEISGQPWDTSSKLVAKAPFGLVWEILPFCLKTCYIEATERNLPKAEMMIEVSPPPQTLQHGWPPTGPETPKLPWESEVLDWLPGRYKLQFFDCGEQTQFLVCDPDSDHFLPEANEILFAALKSRLAAYQELVARVQALSKKRKA